ncbi:MAG: ATP-binding protein [Bacteroidota bacterium]
MVKEKYNKIKRNFLNQYQDESYDIQKKMEYLFYFVQIGLGFFLALIFLRIFGNSNVYLIIGDLFIGLLLLVSILGVYYKKPYTAGNSINFLPFSVLFYHIIEDYQQGLEISLESLFATLAFLVFGLLFISLFAIRRRQMLGYAFLSILTLLVNYIAIVETTFNGEINSVNITHFIAALLGLLTSFLMASLVLHLLHEVMFLAKQTHKVTEKKYTTLFSKMKDSFGYFRLLRDNSGKATDIIVKEYNQSLLNLVQPKNEYIEDKAISELDLPDEISERAHDWIKLFEKIVDNNEEHFDELYSPVVKKWFLITVFSPFPDECVLILKDISDIKKQQKELEIAKEKAEESNRLKSSFLNTISHEIRTPLNQITGLLHVIRESYSDEESLAEMIELINHSSGYLTEIIDNLLEASAMQTNYVEINFREEDIQTHLDNAVEFVKNQIKVANKQENIRFSIDNQLPDDLARLNTDPKMLEHILKKLLSNAVKYTAEGDIVFKIRQKDNNIIFSVSDTGVGIEKDKQDIIFDKFRQADEGNTRKYGGLGLGLAISAFFANKLNGEIHVESTPGEGSVFYFRHPV